MQKRNRGPWCKASAIVVALKQVIQCVRNACCAGIRSIVGHRFGAYAARVKYCHGGNAAPRPQPSEVGSFAHNEAPGKRLCRHHRR
jgi:hypothetical protein